MNVAATTAAEGFPRRVFTVEDIARMIDAGIIGEDEKFELIEGEIVMSAAKGFAHERIKAALTIAVARALPDHLTMGVETTLRLTSTTMLEPDIAVFPKELFRKSSASPSLIPDRPPSSSKWPPRASPMTRVSRRGFMPATRSRSSGSSKRILA
jgi:hypothetical protein